MRNGAKEIARHLAVVLAYAALAAIMHWPLAQGLGTVVAGPTGSDNLEALWHIARAERAVFEPSASLLFEEAIYHPYGWHLASGAVPPWFAVSLAPLTHLVGPVAALNLTYLALLVIAGAGAYGMAYHLTHNRAAAFVAGLIYMTAPVLTLRLRGHVHLLAGAALLPLPFLSAALSLDGETARRQSRFAVVSGLALALTIVQHWYYVFLATLPFAAFVLAYGVKRRHWGAPLKLLCIAGLLSLVLLSPLALLATRAREAMLGDSASFALVESDLFSLSPDLLWAPNRFHPLLAPWAARTFPLTGEQDVSSLGYAATVLMGIGLFRSADRRKWLLLIACGCALVLAMGTTLHWHGQRVEVGRLGLVAAPLALDQFYPNGATGQMPIPLPGLLLARFVPFYSSMRVWGRFSIPLVFLVSSLSALGLATLTRRPRVAWGLAALFGLIVVAEGWVAPYVSPYSGMVQLTDVGINRRPALEAWLARLPEDAAIIEYPRPELDVLALYSQSFHGKKLVNGYMSIPPRHLQENQALLGHLPGGDTLALLREWQVGYILVSESAGPEVAQQIAEIAALPGLRREASFDEAFPGYVRTHVFAIVPDEP